MMKDTYLRRSFTEIPPLSTETSRNAKQVLADQQTDKRTDNGRMAGWRTRQRYASCSLFWKWRHKNWFSSTLTSQ